MSVPPRKTTNSVCDSRNSNSRTEMKPTKGATSTTNPKNPNPLRAGAGTSGIPTATETEDSSSSGASNLNTLAAMSPDCPGPSDRAPGNQISTSGPIDDSSTVIANTKSKKKKESKEARLHRREEAKYKSIYGPKDSRIQLISPAMFAKYQASQNSNTSVSTSKSSSVKQAFPIHSATIPAVGEPSQYKFSATPWVKNINLNQVDRDNEFPALGAVVKPNSSNQNSPELGGLETKQVQPESPDSTTDNKFPNRHKLVDVKLVDQQEWETGNIVEESENNDSNIKRDLLPGTPIDSKAETFSSIMKREAVAAPVNQNILDPSEEKYTSELLTKLNKKKPSKTPMIISIESLLSAKKDSNRKKDSTTKRLSQAASKKMLLFNDKKQQPAGNALDSSGIKVMHRGKMRETPKKKKPSKLKRAILLSRELKKQLLSSQLEHSVVTPSVRIGNDETKVAEGCSESSDVRVNLNEAFTSLQLDETNVSDHLCKRDAKVEANDKSLETASNTSILEECEKEREFSSGSAIKEEYIGPSSDMDMTTQTMDSLTKSEDFDFNDYFHKLVEDNLVVKSIPVEVKIETINQTSNPPPNIIEAVKSQLHNRKFRKYCDMYTTKQLHGIVISLLKELHRFQDKLYKTDIMKYKLKKRYIHGIKEIINLMSINKVQLILIAPDIESNQNVSGGLDDILDVLLSTAKLKNVPVIFTGNRYILGKPIFIKSPVSAIGILDPQGTEEIYRNLLEEASQLRLKYQSDFDAKVRELM